jgi:hypothetical protein
MVKKHILILNWQFPPNQGIGGRRSAKLAKEWKALGHDITIVTQSTKDDGKGSQNWIDEETIHSFDYHYIEEKNHFNALYFQSGLINSIKLWILKKWHGAFTAGNPIDDCRFSELAISKKLESIHQKKPIDLLFVSSAPFSLSVYACRFKKKHPEIHLWCDFRDPWKNAVNYGLQILNNRQREAELKFQKEVGIQSDFLSAPYEAILSEFEKEDSQAKRILIPHFTDRPLTPIITPPHSEVPTITYAGNLYDGSMPYIQTALKTLNILPVEQQPQLHFIGNFSTSIQQEMVKEYNNILFYPWMDQGLDHHLASSQGLIILLSEDNKDFHTTKFYDFLPLGKPYLYIGPKGQVLKTIEDHNLGCSLAQYNSNSLMSYNPEEALQLARKHTAETMALTILNHVFPD